MHCHLHQVAVPAAALPEGMCRQGAPPVLGPRQACGSVGTHPAGACSPGRTRILLLDRSSCLQDSGQQKHHRQPSITVFVCLKRAPSAAVGPAEHNPAGCSTLQRCIEACCSACPCATCRCASCCCQQHCPLTNLTSCTHTPIMPAAPFCAHLSVHSGLQWSPHPTALLWRWEST